MRTQRRSRSSGVAVLAWTVSSPVPILTTARGFFSRFSYQSGGLSAPPFDAITTRLAPSRKNVRGVVRGLPDRRPVVVSRSTGIPATRPRSRPRLRRWMSRWVLLMALISHRLRVTRSTDTTGIVAAWRG
jgi:hypothetical protein